ncbi:unnamed protein product [Prunus armeniaca]
MPPRKKTRSNNMTSQDGPSHADSESRQHASSRVEERAIEGTFTLTDLVTAIHAMGETQREMAEMIKELKNSALKPSEVNEKHPQEESAAAEKESEQKGPSFVTQEDVVAMLEKELSRKRKGSSKEHVNRFIDALGPYASDHNRFIDALSIASLMPFNIVADYRVYLENIGISQFSRLLEAVRKTSMSVKPPGQKTWRNEKKEAHQTLAINDKPSNNYNSRKRKDRETYPPLPCKDEEFHAILDTMIADGVIKPVRLYKIPTREEKNDPRKQTIDEDPLPKRRGNEVAVVITCSDDLLDDDELCHPWRNDPKPPEAIWEPCGNMEKAYWCKYSRPSSYNTPWPLADGWGNNSDSEIFVLDMPKECYSGALSEQQEAAAVTFHNLTEAETSVMERYLSMKQGNTASQVLQRNPKFKSLFDQLGFGPQAREAAAVALMNISVESNSHCFTTQPQGSFLGNDNAIVFTDEDMEVPYPDHRRPLYLEGC